jgi:dTDP-4-dehydrorhamnose reductase
VKILITGAAGLVGAHLARRLSREHDAAALKRSDLDITDRQAVYRTIGKLKPEVIFNCGVLQVDDSEQNPAAAKAINTDGPGYLAEAASEAGAEIVHFSTQYAFDGEPIDRAPYTIDDKPQPVNVYGKSKVAGEQAVRDACKRSYIVRTSWVYGSGKNSFLCTVHQHLRTGKKVRAIDDIWSSTTYVEDLIDRCLDILQRRRYAIYHIVNAGVCSYYEFALEAGRLLGLTPAEIAPLIEITHESDMNRIAARPRYTPLRCLVSEELGLAPMRDWRAALAAYVKTGLK